MKISVPYLGVLTKKKTIPYLTGIIFLRYCKIMYAPSTDIRTVYQHFTMQLPFPQRSSSDNGNTEGFCAEHPPLLEVLYF